MRPIGECRNARPDPSADPIARPHCNNIAPFKRVVIDWRSSPKALAVPGTGILDNGLEAEGETAGPSLSRLAAHAAGRPAAKMTLVFGLIARQACEQELRPR